MVSGVRMTVVVLSLACFSALVGTVVGQAPPRHELEPAPLPRIAPVPLPTSEPIPEGIIRPVQQLGSPIPPPPETVPDNPGANPIRSGLTGLSPGSSTPTSTPVRVAHPPTPVVQIQVMAPSHLAPGKPVPYKLMVANTSQANAHRVTVRMSLPEGVAAISKVEPLPDGWAAQPPKLPAVPNSKELFWSFKTLAKGETRVVEIEFAPAAGAREISAKGYVSFEHGEQVVTNIEKPKLTVKKQAPMQAALNEPLTVVVEVRNSSSVEIQKVRLVETASAGCEFRTDDEAVRGEKGNQRIWQLGNIAPGQAKIKTYQLTARQGGDLATTSNAASEDAGVASETAESTTRILVPGVKLVFTGPSQPVPARGRAEYEAVVSNTGTLTLSDVAVSMSIPPDCEVLNVTNGSRRTKESTSWVIPRLKAGEAVSMRMKLEASSSGKRLLKATARDGRGLTEDSQSVSTIFQGRADLHWKPEVTPPILSVGKTGTVSIVVRNEGGETAKAVRVRVSMPKEVRVVSTSPTKVQPAEDEVIFAPLPILPGKSETYTITFEAKAAGRPFFTMRLEEPETLGEQPLTKQQPIEITSAR